MAEVQLVDRLPGSLWWTDDLWLVPVDDLHFCFTSAADAGVVRTVEWNGQVALRGRRDFQLPGDVDHDVEGRVVQV